MIYLNGVLITKPVLVTKQFGERQATIKSAK